MAPPLPLDVEQFVMEILDRERLLEMDDNANTLPSPDWRVMLEIEVDAALKVEFPLSLNSAAVVSEGEVDAVMVIVFRLSVPLDVI